MSYRVEACWGSPEKVSAWIKRHAAAREAATAQHRGVSDAAEGEHDR